MIHLTLKELTPENESISSKLPGTQLMTGPYVKVHPPFLRKHALYLAKGEFERDEDTPNCL